MDTDATAKAQGANGEPKVIRANQFILEGETGKLRVVLRVFKDGLMLSPCDETGKPIFGLSVFKDEPRLSPCDETGKPRAGLTMGMIGPRLFLYDETGKPRVVLVADKSRAGVAPVR